MLDKDTLRLLADNPRVCAAIIVLNMLRLVLPRTHTALKCSGTTFNSLAEKNANLAVSNVPFAGLVGLQSSQVADLVALISQIADFSPSLKETFLQQYKTYSLTKVGISES